MARIGRLSSGNSLLPTGQSPAANCDGNDLPRAAQAFFCCGALLSVRYRGHRGGAAVWPPASPVEHALGHPGPGQTHARATTHAQTREAGAHVCRHRNHSARAMILTGQHPQVRSKQLASVLNAQQRRRRRPAAHRAAQAWRSSHPLLAAGRALSRSHPSLGLVLDALDPRANLVLCVRSFGRNIASGRSAAARARARRKHARYNRGGETRVVVAVNAAPGGSEGGWGARNAWRRMETCRDGRGAVRPRCDGSFSPSGLLSSPAKAQTLPVPLLSHSTLLRWKRTRLSSGRIEAKHTHTHTHAHSRDAKEDAWATWLPR